MTLSVDPLGNRQCWTYDNLGRVTQVVHGGSGSTCTSPLFSESAAYDANGNITSKTDGAGRSISYVYDANNRMTQAIGDPGTSPHLNAVTQYAYYVSGAMAKRTSAASTGPDDKVTTFSYDARNQLTAVTDSLGRATSYTYDARGNRATRTDPKGVTTSYGYNQRNQQTAITYPALTGTPNVTFSYRRGGQRSAMTDGTGTTTYAYDDLDQLTTVTPPVPEGGWQGSPVTLTYQYDARGNVTRAGPGAIYTYGPEGHLATASMTPHSATYSYDAAGRLQTAVTAVCTSSGTVTADYSYDAAGRTTALSYTFNDTQLNNDLALTSMAESYSYDGASNLLSQSNSILGSSSYTYDALNRVATFSTTYTPPGGPTSVIDNETYAYDAAGNRTGGGFNWASISTAAYEYDAAEQLTRITQSGGSTLGDYQYDPNGNILMSRILATTAASHLTLHTWDAENRLTNVASGPAGCDGVASYRYDGDGLRARTDSYCTGPAAPPFRTESYYVTLGGLPRVALERLNGGAGYRRYLYGHGLVGRTVGDPSGYDSYYADAQGNVRLLISYPPFGRPPVLTWYGYDPFGRPLGSAGSDNAYQYQSEPRDASGLIYLRARYYDPVIGRFLSRDPLPGTAFDPASQQAYAYAGNNPVTRSDPTGMCPGCWAEGYGGWELSPVGQQWHADASRLAYDAGDYVQGSLETFGQWATDRWDDVTGGISSLVAASQEAPWSEGYGQAEVTRWNPDTGQLETVPVKLNKGSPVEPPKMPEKDPREKQGFWEKVTDIMENIGDALSGGLHIGGG